MPTAQKPAEVSLELTAVDKVSDTTEKVEKRLTKYEQVCAKVKSLGSASMDVLGDRFTNLSVAFSNTILLLQDQVVNPLSSMISNFSQAGFSLEKMASSAHLSVEQLGALGFAAKQTGVITHFLIIYKIEKMGTSQRERFAFFSS